MDGRFLEWVWIFYFLTFVNTVHGGAGNPWAYYYTLGPAHWHVDYPQCGGTRQSPIDINTASVEYNEDLVEFNLEGLNETDGVDMKLQNVNGHTVEVILSGNTEMAVTGGDLDGDYLVQQFHFHWGHRDERGSEHEIDQKHFPMEMHIVLYSAKFDNFSEAMDKPEGLAVLAFLFEVGENNTNFESLLSHFDEIEHYGNYTFIPTFALNSLLPEDTRNYFRYDGSLTTPPCYETVVWTIFTSPITVSEQQLDVFRSIKKNRAGEVEVNLVDDFRPLQEVNSRKVYTTQRPLTSSPSSPSSQERTQLCLSTTILSLLLYNVICRSLYTSPWSGVR